MASGRDSPHGGRLEAIGIAEQANACRDEADGMERVGLDGPVGEIAPVVGDSVEAVGVDPLDEAASMMRAAFRIGGGKRATRRGRKPVSPELVGAFAQVGFVCSHNSLLSQSAVPVQDTGARLPPQMKT